MYGWYQKHPNLVVDDDNMNSYKYDYAFTQQLIWETLGYSAGTFFDSTIESNYQNFKKNVLAKIKEMDKDPSFSGQTIQIDYGKSHTLTDTNNVLKNYPAFDKTDSGVRFEHSANSNSMKVTITSECTTEHYTLTDAKAKSLGIQLRYGGTDFGAFIFDDGDQSVVYTNGYTEDPTIFLNFNINLKGNLELKKVDNKGNSIPNTTFKISYNSDMSDIIGTYTTGSNGSVMIKGLKPTTIYIQETKVPDNLILDNTIHSIKIVSNDTVTYTAKNDWKQGYIRVVKKDAESGKVIRKAGTVFDIYNTNNVKVTSITTNADGIATSGLLDYNTYYVKEAKAPNSYTIKIEVSDNIGVIENGKIYEITISNIRVKGSVTISKEDGVTGKKPQGEASLKDAIYGVYTRNVIVDPADGSKIYDANKKIGELVTDDEANATMNNLYLGEYYIKELKASKGYNLDTTIYNFDLTYGGQEVKIVTKKLTVKERVKSQAFQIIKVSSDENGEAELLKGVEFTIKSQKDIDKYGSWEKAPIALNANGETASILVTDSKGHAISDKMPFGRYVVRETKVPDNKYKVPDFKVQITEDSNELQTWRVFNDTSFKSVIAIVKQDVETQKIVKISGAKFKIKNTDTNEYFGYWEWNPLPHYVDEWETDSTGTVMTAEQIPSGRFELEEIESPKGYLISDTPIKFEISSNVAYQTLPDGSTPVITVRKMDQAVKGQINVEKKGEVLTKFENGKFIYEEKGLPGAKYEIVAKENILDSSGDGTIIYEKDKVVDTITTNNEGKATSKKLPLGKYFVREILAPENMIISDEIKDVSLEYKDQNTPVVFSDVSFINERQKVELNVIKKDVETDVGLLGAEFGLYAKENITNYKNDIIVNKGQLIEKAISNENGEVHFRSDLPLVNFEIKELKAPIGYYSSNKVIQVDATYRGQNTKVIELEYEFKNKITEVEISKQDITNSEEIAGANLVIFEKDNPEAVYDNWVSGQDGKNEDGSIKKHLIKGLEVGKTYVLREIVKPHGFALAQDIEFIVKDTNELQKVTMKDELVYGVLKFEKRGEIFNKVEEKESEYGKIKTPIWNKSNLLGAEITIYAAENIKIGNTTYYKENEKVETLESDWESVTSKKLPVGNYYYIESRTPHGYISNNEKHYFTVEDNKSNELQIIESSLYNNRPKFNVSMTKILEEQKIFPNDKAYKDITFGIFAREDIYDYAGNVLIENSTLVAISGITEKGLLENVPDLPNGTYYLKELATNSQYILNDKEYDFEIGYHGKNIAEYIVTIGEKGTIDNKLARGTIQVRKVDTLDENKKLENIEFNISTKKDMSKIIATEKTNNESIATFTDLELGTYYIQEKKQVDGYILNNTIYQVELKQNGDILIINCENKPTQMIFSKVDETGTSELPEAKLQIIDKETGEIIEEWVSTKEPHIVHYLTEGKEYIMKEITAPNRLPSSRRNYFYSRKWRQSYNEKYACASNSNRK